ncbi:MAG: hypothetical protein AABY16_04505 [Nanoarchaeota archaeon]
MEEGITQAILIGMEKILDMEVFAALMPVVHKMMMKTNTREEDIIWKDKYSTELLRLLIIAIPSILFILIFLFSTRLVEKIFFGLLFLGSLSIISAIQKEIVFSEK